MFNFLVTAEGGLTTAGYAVSVIAVLILIILVAVLLQKNTSAQTDEGKSPPTVYCFSQPHRRLL